MELGAVILAKRVHQPFLALDRPNESLLPALTSELSSLCKAQHMGCFERFETAYHSPSCLSSTDGTETEAGRTAARRRFEQHTIGIEEPTSLGHLDHRKSWEGLSAEAAATPFCTVDRPVGLTLVRTD